MRRALTKPMAMTVVALELCSTAVATAPASTPSTGFEVSRDRMDFILAPAAFCRPSDIMFMPNRNTASPPARPNTVSIGAFTRDSPSHRRLQALKHVNRKDTGESVRPWSREGKVRVKFLQKGRIRRFSGRRTRPILYTIFLPKTAAISRSLATSTSNWAGVNCCGPSDRATGGLGCTSIMMESAPAATAA